MLPTTIEVIALLASWFRTPYSRPLLSAEDALQPGSPLHLPGNILHKEALDALTLAASLAKSRAKE